jgi:hypothetical protein
VASKVLRRVKSLRVSVSVTFTPTGGTPNIKTTSVVVRLRRTRHR